MIFCVRQTATFLVLRLHIDINILVFLWRLFQKNTITFKQFAKIKVQVSFRLSVTNFLEKNMFN